MFKPFGVGVAIAVFTVVAGCGGGGGGTVQGLVVPAQVSLVEAQGSGSLQLPAGVAAAVTYADDPAEFWIHDEAMEPLDTVNMILCSVKQTGYDDPAVLNKGPYVALVGCEERGGDSGGAGRGGDAAQFQRFVVDSSRASAGAPHIVKFWFENENENSTGIIYGKVTISGSPDANNPYGKFDLQFKQLGLNQAHDDSNIGFRGYLRTVSRDDGQAEFAFYTLEGDPDSPVGVGEQAYRQRARLVGAAGGTAGRAYSESKVAYNNGGGTTVNQSEYYLQFNSRYVARKKVSGGSVTKVFDRNNFTTQVYRYGVYDASTNVRVDTVSGFGVENANGVHGWAGYHGVWFPDHVTLADGETLTRRSYDSSTPDQTYTSVVVPGRLEKRTRETSTLGNLKNEDLEMFSSSAGSEIRVQWNGTDLVQTGTRSGGSWTAVGPTVITGNYAQGDWLNFYSRERGSVEMVFPATISDSTPVYFWTESTIHGDSAELSGGNLTLYGYMSCLKPNITQNQANFASSETPFYADASNIGDVKTYVFDKTTLLLTESSQPITLANGVTVSGGPGQWGFHSGPLYTTALGALSDMDDATTTYRWSTGLNSWNQLRVLKDSEGEYVTFSPPIRMSYTHNEPANTNYHNKTFSLEWTGTDLHGVPFIENNTDNRWRPAFNIPSGTTITVGNTTYKIKQLEGEQEMNEVGSPGSVISSEGFDLDVTLTAPADDWTDPAVGAMPTVTAPPVFVEGVRQSSS